MRQPFVVLTLEGRHKAILEICIPVIVLFECFLKQNITINLSSVISIRGNSNTKMSNYLDSADSGSDDEKVSKPAVSEEDKILNLQESARLKAEGNDHFSKSEFAEALEKYSKAVEVLKAANLPKDALILLNRSATYLALKRYVPALNDANQGPYIHVHFSCTTCHLIHISNIHNTAVVLDSGNWKGYWRQGVALMAMTKKTFRTKQAIEAFEKCAACASLPDNKKAEVRNELNKARARMEQQDAEV